MATVREYYYYYYRKINLFNNFYLRLFLRHLAHFLHIHLYWIVSRVKSNGMIFFFQMHIHFKGTIVVTSSRVLWSTMWNITLFIWFVNRTRNFISTRLLGRFAPIFYFNLNCVFICKYLLFPQYKAKINKKLADFIIFFRWFQNSIIHKPVLGSREVPNKIWARSVQPFWRLLDTNKQIPTQKDRQA